MAEDFKQLITRIDAQEKLTLALQEEIKALKAELAQHGVIAGPSTPPPAPQPTPENPPKAASNPKKSLPPRPAPEVPEESAHPDITEEDAKFMVLVDGDIKDLVPAFLEARRKQHKILEQHLRRLDWNSLMMSCHKARSPALTFGFFGLADILKELEQAALQKDFQLAGKWLFEFDFFLDHCQIKYEN